MFFNSRVPSESVSGLKIVEIRDHSYAMPDAMNKFDCAPISALGDLDEPFFGNPKDFEYDEIFVSRYVMT